VGPRAGLDAEARGKIFYCILILYFHLSLGLSNCLFPSGTPNKVLYEFIISSTRAACPAHLILLDLTDLVTFGDEYTL
jgi:hypothetical protein